MLTSWHFGEGQDILGNPPPPQKKKNKKKKTHIFFNEKSLKTEKSDFWDCDLQGIVSHQDISDVILSINSGYLLQTKRNGKVIFASYVVTNLT